MKLFLIFAFIFSSFSAKASYQDKCDPNVLSGDGARPQDELLDCNIDGVYLKEVFRGSAANDFGEFLRLAGAGVMDDYDPESNLPALTLIYFNFLECTKPHFKKASCHAGISSQISSDSAAELVKVLRRAGIEKNSEGIYAPADISCEFSETSRCEITAVPPK